MPSFAAGTPTAAILALIVFAMLAGCAHAPAQLTSTSHVAQRTSELSTGPLRHFYGNYSLQVQEISIGGARNQGGTNCVALDGEFHLKSATATMTWTQQPGVSPRMEILFWNDRNVVNVTAGDASATVGVRDLDVSNPAHSAETILVWQVAKGTAVGVAAQMTGTLAIDMEYQGLREPQGDANWSCSIGY